MAKHPASRVLAALEILQAGARISGSEMARRLGVDGRTVRRYIAVLEELGIPITAERGPAGGYALVAGFKLPPMMFSNEEAVAIALGLNAVRCEGVESARAKLDRVMPAGVRARARAIRETVQIAPAPPIASDTLLLLSEAAHRRHGVSLRYRSGSDKDSLRDFDVYGLGIRNGHWYAVGYCHLRRGLRSFRLDRMVSLVPQSRGFSRPDGFDVAAHLTEALAMLPRKHTITVALHTNIESAHKELFPAIGAFEPYGSTVILHSQADDLDWFARELARLPWPFEIIRPAALRHALANHARRLLRAPIVAPDRARVRRARTQSA